MSVCLLSSPLFISQQKLYRNIDQTKMIPGNLDPRRPDKVQRYVPKSSNGTGQEDLTTDYMNILGQQQTTANAPPETGDKHAESSVDSSRPILEDSSIQVSSAEELVNMIPTSPQYGVAIIPSSVDLVGSEHTIITPSTETVTDSAGSMKPPPGDDGKDLHSTPSRNDRFKVVKIASLEPFKRGRWKCMDYVDEAPPAAAQVKVTPQSSSNIQVTAGTGVYLQSQSLPQQQIQQMLLQSGFTNGGPFFSNIPGQMIPPGQYFYPQVSAIQNPGGMPQQQAPGQFINAGQQYFPGGVIQNATAFAMPQGYQNIQYIPANLIQNQNSAFVPTSQTVQLPANFQQSQTYAGQPNVSQASVAPQPLVNGHSSYPPEQPTSLPTQTAKSVILNSTQPQAHIPQQQYQQAPQAQPQVSSSAPNTIIQVSPMVPSQSFDPNSVYTVSVNSLVLEPASSESTTNSNNNTTEGAPAPSETTTETTTETQDDLTKTNPVVNAIDNKIEQAMDLVKSHLMYTVREEVEVLKEKITDLMDRIQQLETENNYLRSQLPKSSLPPVTTSSASSNPTVISSSNVAPVTSSVTVSPATSTANTQSTVQMNETVTPNL